MHCNKTVVEWYPSNRCSCLYTHSEHLFHSTYFANPELVGDGAGGGKMTMEKLSEVLHLIAENRDVVGFTVAEYLPFDEHRLNKMLSGINIFTD